MLLLVCIFALLASLGAGQTIYVSTVGSNVAGCGAQGSPCQTIRFANTRVTSPSTHIVVAAGTYTDECLFGGTTLNSNVCSR